MMASDKDVIAAYEAEVDAHLDMIDQAAKTYKASKDDATKKKVAGEAAWLVESLQEMLIAAQYSLQVAEHPLASGKRTFPKLAWDPKAARVVPQKKLAIVAPALELAQEVLAKLN